MKTAHHTWSLTTWNTHGSARPDVDDLAAAVRSFDADVVAVQEIQRHQAKAVAGRLGWHHVWARKHYPFSPVVWWRAEGHAILSRYPLTDHGTWEISQGESTWTYRHRIMLAATVSRPDGARLRVYDLHLSSDGDVDETIAQATRAAALLAADPTARPDVPCVLAGDLNAHDIVEVVRPFHAVGLVDRGAASTNPSPAPLRRIDYVLAPERAEAFEEQVPDTSPEWVGLSDHLPLTVRFVLEP